MGRSRTPREVPAVETSVGRVEVLVDADGRGRTLVIDGQIHGHVNLTDPARLELDYQARLAAIALALLPDGPVSVVHLGGGAVAVPRALAAVRSDLDQLVVERSAAVIRLAERELGLKADRGPVGGAGGSAVAGLRIRKGDGRAVLQRLAEDSVDLVVGDAFVDDRTPPHMATAEFMTEVHRVLRPTGAYVVNVIDEQPWSRLAAQAAAAAVAFPDVAAAGSRGVAKLRDPGNSFLIAAPRRVPRDRLRAAGAVARHPIALVPDGQLQGLLRTGRARHDADG